MDLTGLTDGSMKRTQVQNVIDLNAFAGIGQRQRRFLIVRHRLAQLPQVKEHSDRSTRLFHLTAWQSSRKTDARQRCTGRRQQYGRVHAEEFDVQRRLVEFVVFVLEEVEENVFGFVEIAQHGHALVASGKDGVVMGVEEATIGTVQLNHLAE